MVNEFVPSPKYVSFVRADKVTGIAPCRLLLLMFIDTRFVSITTPVGMEPTRLLLPNCNTVNARNALRLDGIDPDKLLLLKSNEAKFVKLPNDDGIDPVILLPPNCNDDNVLSKTSEVGNDPTKPNDEAAIEATWPFKHVTPIQFDVDPPGQTLPLSGVDSTQAHEL